MEKIIPAKWFLKDLEAVALEWLAGQFTGRAAEKWTRVVAAARVTATTSGIRHNSVLYRCLRDMVLAYPAVGIKAHLQMRRLRDLPWNRKETVASPGSRSTLVVCRRRGGEGVVRGVVTRRVVGRRRSVHGRIRTIDDHLVCSFSLF